MSASAVYADWIAVDWGTTNLRAWAMQGDRPLAEATSDAGMSKLARDDFEPALMQLIEPWLGHGDVLVLACGMVGARQGWMEAPYVTVPAIPSSLNPVSVTTRDSRIKMRIVPGLSQAKPSPDVMRGEETQIAGFLALEPEFDGVLCLPGTHSKWVQISAGEVVSFQTAMTGEVYQLLSEHSVLRHSVAKSGLAVEAFGAAVNDMMSNPERLMQRLFSLRAENVLNGLSSKDAASRLSGLLIGAELAAARPYWLGQNVAIAGAPELAKYYDQALQVVATSPKVVDATKLTLTGLAEMRVAMSEKV